jgi:hypothetical protein
MKCRLDDGSSHHVCRLGIRSSGPMQCGDVESGPSSSKRATVTEGRYGSVGPVRPLRCERFNFIGQFGMFATILPAPEAWMHLDIEITASHARRRAPDARTVLSLARFR